MKKSIIYYSKIAWKRLLTPMLFFFLFFFASALKSQTTKFKIGFNLNPIISQTSSDVFVSSPDGYIKLKKNKLNYSSGVNFTYYFNSKMEIFTGCNWVRKTYTLAQDKFVTDSTRGQVSHTPIYHTIEIPLLLVYKINSSDEKNILKVLAGTSLDLNNFNTYTASFFTSLTRDTVHTEAFYQFKKFYSVSLLAGLRFEKLINRKGSFEFGVSYHYGFGKLAPLAVKTSVGNDEKEVYTAIIEPRISYVGFDIVYYFYQYKRKTL